MTTPSDYTHYENAVPCGADGLAVGAKGSEVTVVDSAGRLYQGGSVLTLLSGAAASLRVVAGSCTLDNQNSVDTGLTTVNFVAYTRRRAGQPDDTSSLDPMIFTHSVSGGTITFYGWGFGVAAALAGVRLRAATGTPCTLDYIAVGT